MTIQTVRRLECEGSQIHDDILLCGETFEGLPGERADSIRQRARREEGWRRIDGRDLGPDCAARREVRS